MKLPDGCGDMSGDIVRLNRSPYGLNQSGRQWAGFLVETVVDHGMEQCRTYPCVFRMVVDGKVELIMVVHVHDVVIAGSDKACRDFHSAIKISSFPRITSASKLGILVARSSVTGNWTRWRSRRRLR